MTPTASTVQPEKKPTSRPSPARTIEYVPPALGT